ncbi:hypothetical protein FQZ97_813290 [compost metagenome]
MTKLTGWLRALCPSGGRLIGKARTPGMSRSLGSSSSRISNWLRERALQSSSFMNEMLCDTVGKPTMTM